jgi:hypothetical protein
MKKAPGNIGCALLAALAAGAAQAGGYGVGVTFGPPARIAAPVFIGGPAPHIVSLPRYAGSPNLAATIIHPPHAPTFFSPAIPGFVTVAPPLVGPTVIVNTPGPVTVNAVPPIITTPPVVAVQPHVPIAPSPGLFFAPPVTTFLTAPAPTGQVLIIRRTDW